MVREEFVSKLQNFLIEHHYQKGPKEEWVLVVTSPGQTIQMQVNGKLQIAREPDIHVKFKVEFVGEAEVAGLPGIQILFEVSQEKTTLMEYEEVFFYDENARLEQTLKALHFIP